MTVTDIHLAAKIENSSVSYTWLVSECSQTFAAFAVALRSRFCWRPPVSSGRNHPPKLCGA
jgi:hypothetical protein